MILRQNEGYNKNRIPMKFSIDEMNLFCSYILTISPYIKRGHLINMKNLFFNLDDRPFENDEQLYARLQFIRRGISARIDDNMENRIALKTHCIIPRYKDTLEKMVENIESDDSYSLNDRTIKNLNNMISTRLSYSFIHIYQEPILRFFERFQLSEFNSYEEACGELKVLCSSILTDVRQAERVDGDAEFNLMEETFYNIVYDTVKKLKEPSHKLKCGIQLLNVMTGGGFEKGRVYLLLGLTGGFKSGTLLTLTNHLKQYNRNYKPKDPTRRPTVLYITQENSMTETIERLFNMTVTCEEIVNFTPEEVIKLLREKGKLTLTDENNVDIVIRYYPDQKISTDDVYTIIEELEDEGREIIALIHDYIERIKSANPKLKEKRDILGAVANEFHTIAELKDLVVITAAQLNREASKIIDAAAEGNKEDLARLLGSSFISESWNMMKNVDFAMIINREYSKTYEQWFLTFKRIKLRYKAPELSYFNHPFKSDNLIHLIEDEGGECVSKYSLSSDIEQKEFGKGGRKSIRKVKEIQDIQEDDDFIGQFSKKHGHMIA